jgi:hypothetical protein
MTMLLLISIIGVAAFAFGYALGRRGKTEGSFNG